MKTLKPSLVVAALICGSPLSFADTIVMKNGDRYEGRVIREVDDNYLLEVKVSDTIRDEKTVAKADVKYIDKAKPDLKAFEKIEKLVPTPELLKTEDYETRIEKINAFIEEHPKSSKIAKAEEMLNVLNEELKIVSEGGIKYGEEMVAAADYDANAYEYDSIIAAKHIKEAVNRRDFLTALRAFSKYDQTFKDAESRAELVPLIQQVLAAYGSSIKDSLASLDTRLEKRKSGLERMSGEDRSQTQRALEDQQARVEAKYLAEKEARETWITPDAFHKESLDEANRQVESEIKRLETGDRNATPLETPVAETYRVTWGKLSSGDADEKKAIIGVAQTQRVPEIYLEKLRLRAGVEKN